MKTPVSPKVTAGANWAAYATLLLTLLSTVTPDSLDFLGKYSPIAYGLVVGASYALGAYLKADPLRDAGQASAGAAPDISSLPPAPVAEAPASVYPAAKVDAAMAEPVTVTPVFESPAG